MNVVLECFALFFDQLGHHDMNIRQNGDFYVFWYEHRFLTLRFCWCKGKNQGEKEQ